MEVPSNPRLIKAVHTLLDAYSDDAGQLYRDVLEALVTSTLIAGDDGEPATVDTEDGEMLAVFTDLVELSTFDADLAWKAPAGEEAIRLVASGDYDGLVVNPAGRSFELSKDDVIDLFEIDP